MFINMYKLVLFTRTNKTRAWHPTHHKIGRASDRANSRQTALCMPNHIMKYMLCFGNRNKNESSGFLSYAIISWYYSHSVSFDECKPNQSDSSNKTLSLSLSRSLAHTHRKRNIVFNSMLVRLHARTHLTQSNEQHKTSTQQFTLSVIANREFIRS